MDAALRDFRHRLATVDDVEMLVAVLLARQTPLPLAIGLFGEWGGGKSFFMALIQLTGAAHRS